MLLLFHLTVTFPVVFQIDCSNGCVTEDHGWDTEDHLFFSVSSSSSSISSATADFELVKWMNKFKVLFYLQKKAFSS